MYPGVSASPHWPSVPRFAWQNEDGYSQLRAARDEVLRHGNQTNLVNVVLLDTGVHNGYRSLPVNFDYVDETNIYDYPSDRPNWSLHGTATASILGGQIVEGAMAEFFPGSGGTFSEYFGGAPWAHTTTYRIHNSVVHLSTETMARGISMAASNAADVISISHGGTPTRAWADAVNYAYLHGSAIFAASGDYVDYILIHSPHYVVYPAAFSRVICVPGVTATYNFQLPTFFEVQRGKISKLF